MNDLKLIKKRILEEDKVEEVFEAIGCNYIKRVSNRIEAQLPSKFNKPNKRAVQCKLNESLSCNIWNTTSFSGDIFFLVSFINNDIEADEDELRKDLPKAKAFICNLFSWNEYMDKKGFIPNKKDYLETLKNLKNKTKKYSIEANKVLDESILEEYYHDGQPLPYQGWIDEGISYRTQILYNVGFDMYEKRITIPMRNRYGQLVGVKGRIFDDEDSDMKYKYIVKYLNSLEWFNFHNAKPYIEMENEVVIFEAEKSPMKCYDFGLYNTLAIGASKISPKQRDMIKEFGDIDVIFAYDKGFSPEEIFASTKLFHDMNVYIVYDEDGLLDGKDAPVDRGFETWKILYDNRKSLKEFAKKYLQVQKNMVE